MFVHAYLCVIGLNSHGSMTDCNGNPMQFMVSFLVHPISLHCLLNFNMLCLYSVLAVTVKVTKEPAMDNSMIGEKRQLVTDEPVEFEK